MEEIVFDVQGSSEIPYKVTFIRHADLNVSAHCSCMAGENGLHCKHRLNILGGVADGIVSDNFDQIEIIRSWVCGTDLGLAVNEMLCFEKEAKKINKALSAAKKKVARVMRG